MVLSCADDFHMSQQLALTIFVTGQPWMTQNFADGCTQNLMKGYIARERGIVVLSKGGAFPGTGV